jgi:diacylglycerol kinase
MTKQTAKATPTTDDHASRVHPYAQKGFMPGAKHAWHGVLHVVRHERNARIHLMFAVAALLLGVLLKVSNAELAAVFFAVIIVFLAEMFNTAIERTLDLVEPNEHADVKIIKDMSAGAVLLASVAAVMVGAAIFVPALARFVWGG